MKNVQLMDCTQPATIRLERVNFFNRQLLTADDLTTERDYFLQKLRRHNRFMHGWGVVCGLSVIAAPDQKHPWMVQVGSGYALGPYGDEIFIGEPVLFDLSACINGGVTNPCEPSMVTPGGAGTSTVAYLAIRYSECLSRPVQTASSGCGCDSDPCQYSRIRDSFQIQCLPELPPQPPPPPGLCEVVRGAKIAACPPCPTDPWVVLAKIKLPSATTMNISNSDIDTSVRRVILSTAVLQEQLIHCCCGGTRPSSSSSSAVSSSSSSSRPNDGPVILRVGQRATRIASVEPAPTQITVTVANAGAQTANNIVVVVDLSPELDSDRYKLQPDATWDGGTLAELKSKPFTLLSGKAQALSFNIAPIRIFRPVTVVSNARAMVSSPATTVNANPLNATVGG
jgi:hypothetical protein